MKRLFESWVPSSSEAEKLIPYIKRDFSPAYRKSFSLLALAIAGKEENQTPNLADLRNVARKMHSIMYKHNVVQVCSDENKMTSSKALRHVIGFHKESYYSLSANRRLRKATTQNMTTVMEQIGFSSPKDARVAKAGQLTL